MIVEKNIRAVTIIKKFWGWLLFYLILSVVVCILYIEYDVDLDLPNTQVAILGTALSILMGFRVNAAYDRWWEARKIWGSVVNYSRSFARQVIAYIGEDEKQNMHLTKLVYRQIAFTYALGYRLRKENDQSALNRLLTTADFEVVTSSKNIPNTLLLHNLEHLKELRAKNLLTDFELMRLDESLTVLTNNLGEAERIKNTPFPLPYSYFSFMLIHIFGCLIPFGMVGDLGYTTIIFSLLVVFIFLVIERIAYDIQDPFENKENDIAISAICTNIEIDLKDMLGKTHLPRPERAEDGILM